ncbi:hypothetical protein [Halobacterium yunchengense]|uniref:hypothetical protein n=1 Tax=Halobacterium yunchengense TaxID=3108497 RepID=UPI0030095141
MSDVVLVDATTLIALGSVGRVDLLGNFDGRLAISERVEAEVTTDPAAANVSSFLDEESRLPDFGLPDETQARAVELLGEERINGDVDILAGVILANKRDEMPAVVSDDRRVRTVARGLGATVTGTVGVVVRAVHEGMAAEDAKDLVRDVDSHGLHMTGELREKAFELIDEAAED